MANTNQYTATLGYARYGSTSWTSGKASQGAYASGTMTASDSRVGVMVFSGLGEAVKGKNITAIGLAFKAESAGQGGSKVLSLCKSNYQTANTSVRGSAYVGDALGTLSGNFYDHIQTYDLTSGEVFNNLKAYFEAGNSAIVCYNGEKTKMGSHDYSNNYMTLSVVQISITFEDGGCVWYNDNGSWQKCEVWYNDNGSWQKVAPYYNNNGTWTEVG